MDERIEMTAGLESSELLEMEFAPEELATLECALAAALSPTYEPAAQFVEDLEQELALEAEQQHAKQQLLQTLGIVGGGVLTIIAGVVGFVLLRRQQKEKAAQEAETPVEAPVTLDAVPVPAG